MVVIRFCYEHKRMLFFIAIQWNFRAYRWEFQFTFLSLFIIPIQEYPEGFLINSHDSKKIFCYKLFFVVFAESEPCLFTRCLAWVHLLVSWLTSVWEHLRQTSAPSQKKDTDTYGFETTHKYLMEQTPKVVFQFERTVRLCFSFRLYRLPNKNEKTFFKPQRLKSHPDRCKTNFMNNVKLLSPACCYFYDLKIYVLRGKGITNTSLASCRHLLNIPNSRKYFCVTLQPLQYYN